jgi:purine nucleosidase
MTRPLLIDTDPGIDDALALLLAWGSPEVAVEALTVVAGNVSLALGTTNARRLIDLRRPSPTPTLAAGAAQPLARPLVTADHYHGHDGLGGLDDWPPVTARAIAPAVETLLDVTRRQGSALTLIALGPLTNLALALEREPGLLARPGRVVVMAGAVDVPGNVTPEAEFNVHVDPEAAARVLAAARTIDLVPLDATRQALLERAQMEAALARRPGPLAARVLALSAYAFGRERGRMTLHDPLAVGLAVDPTLAEWESLRIDVGADGRTRRVAGAANCRVARRVDRARFLAMFLERLCPAS